MADAKQIVNLAVKALSDKKAEGIKVLDIGKLTVIADYFVIANGTNTSQVDAMVDNVTEELLKISVHPTRVEGTAESGWVLLDYQDVVIHIFSKQERMFYDLERIWKDSLLTNLPL